MTSFRFIPNRTGVREIMRGEKLVAHVDRQAERVVAAVQRIAPTLGVPEYKYTIGKTNAEVHGDTVSVEVYSSDPFWHLVEFGSANNPAHHPLERGTAAVLEFDGSGR